MGIFGFVLIFITYVFVGHIFYSKLKYEIDDDESLVYASIFWPITTLIIVCVLVYCFVKKKLDK